eukprot:scaffold54817_cov73-Phaeocystis_antarctica.AAC.5
MAATRPSRARVLPRTVSFSFCEAGNASAEQLTVQRGEAAHRGGSIDSECERATAGPSATGPGALATAKSAASEDAAVR